MAKPYTFVPARFRRGWDLAEGGNPSVALQAAEAASTPAPRRDGGPGTSSAPEASIGPPFGYSAATDAFGRAISQLAPAIALPFGLSTVLGIANRGIEQGKHGFDMDNVNVTDTLGLDIDEAMLSHNLRSKGLEVNPVNAATEIANINVAQHSDIAEPTPDRSRTMPFSEQAAAMMGGDSSSSSSSSSSTGGLGVGGATGSGSGEGGGGPAGVAAEGGGGGPGGGPGGSCFITTAICERRGEPDDGITLTTLRRHRDEHMMKTEHGRDLVAEYKRWAPIILKNMPADSIDWTWIESIVDTAVILINREEPRLATRLYTVMVEELKARYCS